MKNFFQRGFSFFLHFLGDSSVEQGDFSGAKVIINQIVAVNLVYGFLSVMVIISKNRFINLAEFKVGDICRAAA